MIRDAKPSWMLADDPRRRGECKPLPMRASVSRVLREVAESEVKSLLVSCQPSVRAGSANRGRID